MSDKLDELLVRLRDIVQQTKIRNSIDPAGYPLKIVEEIGKDLEHMETVIAGLTADEREAFAAMLPSLTGLDDLLREHYPPFPIGYGPA